jgi:transcriptional regulator with XRE-family HTH domain
MSIGSRIQEIAKSKNISPQELGKKIGKTRQAIYDIYNSRVSVNVDVLLKIADALDEKVISFFMGDPDDYYKLVPMAIPINVILELMSEIHENAKKGKGLVNLHLSKSREGIFILEKSYDDLKDKLGEVEINRFGNNLYESYMVSSPEKLNR